MKFDYRNERPFLIFDHKKVPLPYHLKETALFDSEKSEVIERSKDDLCVLPIAPLKANKETEVETLQTEGRERRDSKGHTQISSKDPT